MNPQIILPGYLICRYA